MAGADDGRAPDARIRRVLIVSPHFPPSSLAAAHRARHLAAHLGAHGWRPTVITVRPEDYEDALDHRLAALVPGHVEILRVPALPRRLARRVGIGDIGLRGYAGLRRAVLGCLDRDRHDLVFITGFPFYPMLIAPAVRRRGVAVVLDFQDPWISDWGAARPPASKAGLAHRLALHLEPRAVAAASGIMSVSANQNDAMRRRYPEIPEALWCALPIGGDWGDFAAVPAPAASGPVVLFAGTFPPRSGAVFSALFRAVASLRAAEPGRLAGVRFRFVGTAAVTDPRAAPVVTPIAAAQGVADLVEEIPMRLPYLDALGEMWGCAVNLMVGSDEPHYTASRIYPALMSGRPFLSLYHAQSSAHTILSRCGGGIAVGFDAAGGPAAAEPALRDALARVLAAGDRLGPVDPAAIAPFTGSEIARRCARFFERVLAAEGSSSGRAAP
ncbi:Glycosyl transferase 4-like domain [Methylobacterium sp. 174MFSha1.1]|uniref:glycosyltransferase n=1 Tax=Methylobacterium sp. 174MFSha1.1 TaxID=1502749 RepID=UPI0008E19EF3|nr:glycosyltransferase [Methylobacterium sp. 174MFSha1.1]SFU47295.1 Glycosyl transferase 4-like domain [Methylobacterium sp. 174MFSha1.1]